jgi:hypothetical protein
MKQVARTVINPVDFEEIFSYGNDIEESLQIRQMKEEKN